MSKVRYQLNEAIIKKEYCFFNKSINIPKDLFLNKEGREDLYFYYIIRMNDGSGCLLVKEATAENHAIGTLIFNERLEEAEDGTIKLNQDEYMSLYYEYPNSYLLEENPSISFNNQMHSLFEASNHTINLRELYEYKDAFIGKYVYIWKENLDPELYRCVDVKRELIKQEKDVLSGLKVVLGTAPKNSNVRERYKFHFSSNKDRICVSIEITSDGELIVVSDIPEGVIFTTLNACQVKFDDIRSEFKNDLMEITNIINANAIDHKLMNILIELHKYCEDNLRD